MDNESVIRALNHSLETEASHVRDNQFEGPRADNGESEWVVFEDDDDAEAAAIAYVEELFDESAENMSPEILEQHIYISDKDRRILAGEEADSYMEGLDDDDDAITEADMEDDKDKLETELDGLDEKLAVLMDSDDGASTSEIKEKLKEIQKKLDGLPAAAREKIQEERSDRIYKELEDPIQYFVNEQGMSMADLMKANFIQIDAHAAAIDVVSSDGAAVYLDSVNSSEEKITDPDTGKTYLAFGTN
jgi:hypothetical protein